MEKIGTNITNLRETNFQDAQTMNAAVIVSFL